MGASEDGTYSIFKCDIESSIMWSVGYFHFHEFWCNSSDVPAMPSCLAIDRSEYQLDQNTDDSNIRPSAPILLSIQCLLFPNPDNLQAGVQLPGPDPLSHTTEIDDIIVYMSAFVPARLLR